MNRLYHRTPWGPRKNKLGEAFENHCKLEVMNLLAARGFVALPQNIGWDLYITWYFPKLENAGWQEKGTGERFSRKDVDGPIKLMQDATFRAINENDASDIDLHMKKRDGHGSARAEFVLQEKELMAELPNTTELSQTVNERGAGVRVSPADHPALVDYYATQQPAYGESRTTPFDMWRVEIMSQVMNGWEKHQSQIRCPARSGRIDACYGCTDMMVVHCLLNNPLTTDNEGRAAGLFDLCVAREGLHVRRVDREGGAMPDPSIPVPSGSSKTDPQTYVVSIITLMLNLEEDPKLVVAMMNAAHDMLKALGENADPPGQEAMLKVAILLSDAASVGCPKPLPKPPFWYKDVTSATVPSEYRDALQKAQSIYNYAKSTYRAYREQVQAWQNAGSPKPGAAAAPATPAAAPEAAPAKKRTTKAGGKKGKEGPEMRPGDLPGEPGAPAAPPAAPVAPPVQLDLPMALPPILTGAVAPAAASPATPKAVTDASIPGPPAPGMPRMQPIGASGSSMVVQPKPAAVAAECVPTVGIPTHTELMAELKCLNERVEKVNNNLKKVMAFFSEKVLPAIRELKSGAKDK